MQCINKRDINVKLVGRLDGHGDIFIVRDKQGNLSVIKDIEISDIINSGGTIQGVCIDPDNGLCFEYGIKYLPVYVNESGMVRKIEYGGAHLVAVETGDRDIDNLKVLMIDCVDEFFNTTVGDYNEAVYNKYGMSTFKPLSMWYKNGHRTLTIDNHILKRVWRMDRNGKIVDFGEDKRKSVYLIGEIESYKNYANGFNGERDKLGFKVLNSKLTIQNIPNVEMQNALFINATVKDEYNQVTAIGRVNSRVSVQKAYINSTFKDINSNSLAAMERFRNKDCYSACGLETDLCRLYESLNSRYFNNELPHNVKVVWNKRLSRCAGWCSSEDREINISYFYIEQYHNEVTPTLLHEMIHLRERDHGNGFKRELKRLNNLGASVEMYSKGRAKEPKYTVRCCGCGKTFTRDRLVNVGARCAQCACTEFVYRINGVTDEFIPRENVAYFK